jgi:chromosomal replication initiator protein
MRGRIISQIISETAERHGYSVKEMTGPARYASLCRARFEAMWLAYQVKRPDGTRLYSLPQIGRAFGRDHTTVINAIRRHEAFLAAEKVAA